MFQLLRLALTCVAVVWSSAALAEWRGCVQAARTRLLAQADLASQLLGFVLEKR